jgi:hypothetical protein
MHIRSQVLPLTRLCCLIAILVALGCWYLARSDRLFLFIGHRSDVKAPADSE